MKNKFLKMTFAGLVLGVSSFAHVVLVLQADLTVENTITISATSGTSLADVSGNSSIGFYLADFFDSTYSLIYTLQSGNLSSANNTSDNSPQLWSDIDSIGLNVWEH